MMMPVRFGKDGPVVGSVTMILVKQGRIVMNIELDEGSEHVRSVNDVVTMSSFSFNSEEE